MITHFFLLPSRSLGLHIPESYLTALVQATCRKNGWPLDRSTLYTQVTKWQTAEEVTERAGQGMLMIINGSEIEISCILDRYETSI